MPEYLLRRKSAHPIDESGSLFSELWKTLVSSDGEGGILQIREGANGKYKLRDQAPHWPIPTSIIQEQDLETFQNRKEKALAKKINGNGIGMNLGHSIQKWPTPQSRDYKSPDLPNSGNSLRKMTKGWTIDLNSSVIPWSTPTVAMSNIYPEKTPKPRNSDTSGQLDNSFQSRLEGHTGDVIGKEGRAEQERSVAARSLFPAGQGTYQYDYEEPRTIESSMVYTIDGYNFTEDLHRAIGNSVVEQTAELAFISLLQKHINN